MTYTGPDFTGHWQEENEPWAETCTVLCWANNWGVMVPDEVYRHVSEQPVSGNVPDDCLLNALMFLQDGDTDQAACWIARARGWMLYGADNDWKEMGLPDPFADD